MSEYYGLYAPVLPRKGEGRKGMVGWVGERERECERMTELRTKQQKGEESKRTAARLVKERIG